MSISAEYSQAVQGEEKSKWLKAPSKSKAHDPLSHESRFDVTNNPFKFPSNQSSMAAVEPDTDKLLNTFHLTDYINKNEIRERKDT